MNIIGNNIERIKATLPAGVELVAVSKFHPAEAIREAYNAGQRIFGESRVQEFLTKVPNLPADIRWHFIGHLQTNKVRQIMGKTALIESVDTLKLLDCIDRESVRAGVTTRVLMQVHVAAEETKFGFDPEELIEWFRELRFSTLKATHICGLMGMASNTEDMEHVRADFRRIHDTYMQIRQSCKNVLQGFDLLSMGMSHDYPIALQEGANLVRVGTAIFGERSY